MISSKVMEKKWGTPSFGGYLHPFKASRWFLGIWSSYIDALVHLGSSPQLKRKSQGSGIYSYLADISKMEKSFLDHPFSLPKIRQVAGVAQFHVKAALSSAAKRTNPKFKDRFIHCGINQQPAREVEMIQKGNTILALWRTSSCIRSIIRWVYSLYMQVSHRNCTWVQEMRTSFIRYFTWFIAILAGLSRWHRLTFIKLDPFPVVQSWVAWATELGCIPVWRK